jgi:integrase
VTIKSAPATGDVDDEDEAEHVKALSATELEAVLAAVPDEWRLFFRFLADSGLRIGEAVALKWGDVDTGAALVQVRRRRYRGRICLRIDAEPAG